MMQECTKCYHKFSYLKLLRACVGINAANGTLTCEECGQAYGTSPFSRFMTSILIAAVPLVAKLLFFLDIRYSTFLIFYLLWAACIAFCMPFFVRFKSVFVP